MTRNIEPMVCTITDAATMLCVTHIEILNLCDRGQLKSYGRGKSRRIFISSIKACEVGEYHDYGGYVYIIHWHGYYKIGKAKDVPSRIRDIGCSHPVPPTVFKVIPTNAMGRLEAQLHKKFAHKRKSGEWFDLDENDLMYIKRRGPYVIWSLLPDEEEENDQPSTD